MSQTAFSRILPFYGLRFCAKPPSKCVGTALERTL